MDTTATHTFDVPRREVRMPIEVGVELSSRGFLQRQEKTFTQNVSSGGARVWSTRRWRKNERLTLSSATGDFKSAARVAYCEPALDSGFAVGLELLESKGQWILS